METLKFESQSSYPYDRSKVFAWHQGAGAFDRLSPPWQNVRLLETSDGIRDGSIVRLELEFAGLKFPWTLRHSDYLEDRQFRDTQVKGPFTGWDHLHTFEDRPNGGCLVRDRIEYSLPVGRLIDTVYLHAELERLFRYRTSTLTNDLTLHDRFAATPRSRILVSGASGLVGTALTAFLRTAGHTVHVLRRGPAIEGIPTWDPAGGDIRIPPQLEFDAAVHLSGTNVAAKRWSPEFKKSLRDSRVDSTHLLCAALAALPSPPKAFITASAIGYYGDRGDEELTEDALPGTGFFPELCKEWEAATEPASEAGIRVAHLRIAPVIAGRGGPIKKMLVPYLAGMGGPLGSGKQFWSWIALQDLLGIIEYALFDRGVTGPINAVAPNPLRQKEFSDILAHVVKRPAFVPMPAKALELLVGELAKEAILASSRVVPQRLMERGYKFIYPRLEEALRYELGR